MKIQPKPKDIVELEEIYKLVVGDFSFENY